MLFIFAKPNTNFIEFKKIGQRWSNNTIDTRETSDKR